MELKCKMCDMEILLPKNLSGKLIFKKFYQSKLFLRESLVIDFGLLILNNDSYNAFCKNHYKSKIICTCKLELFSK